jgi:hypothetical protein
VVAVTQNRRPATWAGISKASTISKNRDLLHGFLYGELQDGLCARRA